MMRTTLVALALSTVVGEALAQSNSRGAGYDGALTDISSARAWGRRGPAYPGGEVGVSFQNQLCNPGSINIEWRAPMLPDHPKFGFLVVRQIGDRLVQISDWSYCKHAFYALSSPSVCGGTCQSTNGSQLGVSCSDIYSNSNNANRTYLGPPAEIDPWLGTWNPVGSYFDVGDPQTGLGPADGVRSLNTNGFDSVKNRVTIKEQDLVGASSGSLFFQIHVIHEGEPLSNRGNNTRSRPFNLNWGGSSWTASTTGTSTYGTVLTRWNGASLSTGTNGNDDGRFEIAVKVTGPVDGLWHYEYAVLNIDNNRGGAAFHLPVCPTGRVLNIGSRDIDSDPLNDWVATVANGEIVWNAGPNNPHNWNQLMNFWFDSDVAPIAGNATIDAARMGPGALSLTVPTQVPGLQPSVYLGAGCGTPALELVANGVPSAGNAAFAIDILGAPNTGLFAFYSFAGSNQVIAPGCTQFLDGTLLGTHGFLLTNGAGHASIPLGVPAGFAPTDLYWQAAGLQTGGPVVGTFGLSNGLLIRLSGTGCN
ncbi:MAG: hypothetical protein KDC48_11760 [Planctomycetes bacterium]|nr:hypothetical protein [Planctomycetota bacterium]